GRHRVCGFLHRRRGQPDRRTGQRQWHGIPLADLPGLGGPLAAAPLPPGLRPDGASRGKEAAPVIQPLRRAHRLLFFLWSAALPFVSAAGLASRHGWPHPSSLRPEIQSTRPAVVRRVSGPEDVPSVEMLLGTPVTAPDVLVYWTPQKTGAELPRE